MAARINSLPSELLSNFQIIHSRVRELDESKKKILVLHDLALDPEVKHLANGGWKKFDKLVFVSHWQKQQYQDYLGIPPSASVVIKNAVEKVQFKNKPDHKEKLKLIYFSTPHRGLDLLYFAFDALSKEFPHIELDVFSSFDLYGWGERDANHKELLTKLEEHPKINYSKSVSNGEIRTALESAHILAYPSTWPETSCLVLIEAMCHGLLCVHSSLAALPETSMNLTHMYEFDESPAVHVNTFYRMLRNVVMNYDEMSKSLYLQSSLSNVIYDWDTRKTEWTTLLNSLL